MKYIKTFEDFTGSLKKAPGAHEVAQENDEEKISAESPETTTDSTESNEQVGAGVGGPGIGSGDVPATGKHATAPKEDDEEEKKTESEEPVAKEEVEEEEPKEELTEEEKAADVKNRKEMSEVIKNFNKQKEQNLDKFYNELLWHLGEPDTKKNVMTLQSKLNTSNAIKYTINEDPKFIDTLSSMFEGVSNEDTFVKTFEQFVNESKVNEYGVEDARKMNKSIEKAIMKVKHDNTTQRELKQAINAAIGTFIDESPDSPEETMKFMTILFNEIKMAR